MKPIKVKAWVICNGDSFADSGIYCEKPTYEMLENGELARRVLIITPRHFDVVPKKKGKVRK